jgi:hypothetical protein
MAVVVCVWLVTNESAMPTEAHGASIYSGRTSFSTNLPKTSHSALSVSHVVVSLDKKYYVKSNITLTVLLTEEYGTS